MVHRHHNTRRDCESQTDLHIYGRENLKYQKYGSLYIRRSSCTETREHKSNKFAELYLSLMYKLEVNRMITTLLRENTTTNCRQFFLTAINPSRESRAGQSDVQRRKSSGAYSACFNCDNLSESLLLFHGINVEFAADSCQSYCTASYLQMSLRRSLP